MSTNKNLVFITEARFFCDSNGIVYYDRDFDIKLWDRYLQFFHELIVVARIQQVNDSEVKILVKNTNPNVKFVKLPYFVGLKALLVNFFALKNCLKDSLYSLRNNAFILRVPGIIGFNAAKILKKQKSPYGIEVVGDPSDVFAKGNFNHPLRPLLKFLAVSQLKFVVKGATSVLYVTQLTLQKKYPPKNNVLSIGVSDVRIDDNVIKSQSKLFTCKPVYQIISVGSLAQMYKSPDILLKSVKLINDQKNSFKVKLVWLGDGIYKSQMIKLSEDLNINNYVDFKGNVSHEEVMSQINTSDLFVLASKTEGLPRVIIEAMAMGLPIIATNVGGIPELLSQEVLVEPNNPDLLAKRIIDILENRIFYNDHSNKNLIKAQEFKNSVLDKKRRQFYNSIMNI